MSLTLTQIRNKIRRITGTDTNSYPEADLIVDCNLALDEAFSTIFKISKSGWQFDDGGHGNEPSLTANIVSGTRTYDFSEDAGGNLTLDVYRVMVSDSSGLFSVIKPVSQRTDPEADVKGFIDGQNLTGLPTKYDKYGTTISLDPIPDYSKADGLKLFINREASYFVEDGTSAVAGMDGLCHDFLYLKPSYEWARDHNLQITDRLYRDLEMAKIKIDERYRNREIDRPKRLLPKIEDTR